MLTELQAKLIRILRWSERYTKTDMVYLAHGSFWLSSSSVLTAAVSFGLALAYANLVPKEVYGNYRYILTIFGILSVTCLRGMDTAITQAAARGNDGTIVQGLHNKMKWGLLGSLGAFGCAAYYYFYANNSLLAVSFLVAAFFIPLMEPYGIFNAVLVGKKDFKLSSILGTLGQVIAGIALLPVLIITKNYILIFAAYCTIWTLTRYWSYRYTLQKFPPNGKYELGASSYAVHSSIVGAMSILIGSIDSVLVFHYLGAVQLALFTFATAPVAHFRTILGTPSILAVPKLAGLSAASIRKILYKRSGALFLIGIAMTLMYCALSYPFYRIFFPQYLDAIPFSLLFSLTILLQVGNTLVGPVINSRATLIPRRLLYMWNIPSVVIATSAIFLIPVLGLWGAIIGQVLSYAASCAIAWFMWYSIQDVEHSTP
jgi:O-antigen/teichoic acid export membrane protein